MSFKVTRSTSPNALNMLELWLVYRMLNSEPEELKKICVVLLSTVYNVHLLKILP